MREEAFSLGAVPAVVYGEEADRVFLFVHGRCGCKEEGRDFAALAAPFGWQVLAVDLPEHGARQGGPEPLDPWHAVPELQSAMEYARGRWRRVALRATSIGAWFSMLAFAARPGRTLTVMEDGEHWFHTPQQLAVLEHWTLQRLTEEGEAV